MSLWFQPSTPTRTSPASSRQQGFGQVASGFSPFSQDEIDAPQRTSAAEGVMPNFSSRISISNNIDNSWNFDGPNFNDNSIAFHNEINNNITQNFQIIDLVDSMGGQGGTAGVTSITAGTGISVSSSTGNVTITNTATAGTVDCATDVLPCLTSWPNWGSAANENGMLNSVTFDQTGLTFTSRNLNFKAYGFYNTGTAGTSTTVSDSSTWPSKYVWIEITSATLISPGRWSYGYSELSASYNSVTADYVFTATGNAGTALNEWEFGNVSTRMASYTTASSSPYYIENSTGYSIQPIKIGMKMRATIYHVLVKDSSPVAYTLRCSFNAPNPVVGQCPVF